LEELKKHRDLLKNEINNFFDKELITKSEDVKIYDYFVEYALRGKFVRGSLLLFVHELLSKEISKDALITASSVEVLHSAILMIDDLIDKDDTRRGKPAIHVEVRELIPNSNDLNHDANSIAQCTALIGTYYAYASLARVKSSLIKIISEEFTKTGFAELNEIILAQKHFIAEDDVLNIYKFKTAKYTITLPFRLAFILSEKEFTKELEQITDNIGILFQMKDDLLELEQNSEYIGKSNVSDIKAGKQHYPRKLLEKFASQEDLVLIKKYYSVLDDCSVEELQKLYKKYDVVKKAKEIIFDLKKETLLLINKQELKIKEFCEKLLDYVVERAY
jgi:geranylgeranyl diphosphate synthase, type II